VDCCGARAIEEVGPSHGLLFAEQGAVIEVVSVEGAIPGVAMVGGRILVGFVGSQGDCHQEQEDSEERLGGGRSPDFLPFTGQLIGFSVPHFGWLIRIPSSVCR